MPIPPAVPLVPFLRLLLELDIYQPPPSQGDRLRTPWEVAAPLVLAQLRIPGVEVGALRLHVVRMKFDGIHWPNFAGKTGEAFRAEFRASPLGGVESSTPLSSELARLDSEGFGRMLAERLRANHSQEIDDIFADLFSSTPTADQPSTSNSEEPCEPGPETESVQLPAATAGLAGGHEGMANQPDSTNGAHDRGPSEALSPLQYDMLDALRRLKAIDHEKRVTGQKIAEAVGGDATDQSVKAPLADLTRRGLVESKTGRTGGTWLTPEGLELINRLRPKQ